MSRELKIAPSYIRDYLICPRRLWYSKNLPGINDSDYLAGYNEISVLLSNTLDLYHNSKPDRIHGPVAVEIKQGDYTRRADVYQVFAYMCEYDLERGMIYYIRKNKVLIVRLIDGVCDIVEEIARRAYEVINLDYPPEGTYDEHICKYCSYRDVCSRYGVTSRVRYTRGIHRGKIGKN